MRWTARPDTKTDRNGRDAIMCDEWTITRTRHGGEEMYTLWQGKAKAGYFDTAAAAKQAAKEKAE